MLADDVDTIIAKRAEAAAAAAAEPGKSGLPLNSVLPEARLEEGSANSAAHGVNEVKMESLGSVTFWLRYMGYLPWSVRPHFLNKLIPYLHIFGVTFCLIMRGIAVRVDYRLNDGSFSNNMYLNAANLALFGGCILMLGWTRSRTHSSFGSDVEALATSKMEESAGGDDEERLLQPSKGASPRPMTGTQHSNLLLSFTAERVGADHLHRKLTESLKGYMFAFVFFFSLYAIAQVLGIIQIINGSRPVYERFDSPDVDKWLQIIVQVISTFQAIPIAFLSPLYIYIYTQVFNELLDELVFFVATKRYARRIEDGLADHQFELNNRDVLLLIIAEHKLIDSLLRVTCKRVEKFVAFALAMLATIMLLVVFKVVVAGGEVSQSESRAASILFIVMALDFCLVMMFLRMLSRITTKAELLPQMVNRLTAQIQNQQQADVSDLISMMCTTNFLMMSRMAWRIFGVRVTNVMVIRMVYVVGSLGVYLLSRLGLEAGATVAEGVSLNVTTPTRLF